MNEREENILQFWEENKIFSKTLSQSKGRKEFVFYEGPPTANGKPGIHHLEARAFKDIVPRYKTMQGFHVARKGGWDTHGLPVELQVEKQLGLKSKKEIEKYGIAEFNKKCKESVWEYKDLWEKFTDRIGYWLDQKKPYITYENNYIESVWGVLKTVDEKKLLYKDFKVVPWCPRCGTALSSHELGQPGAYQDDKDLSVIAKFKIVGQENTFFLAWTTTPWTLPGNVALAVGEKIDYVKIKKEDSFLVLAKARINVIEGEYEIVEEMKGEDLIGLEYEPLYDFLKDKANDKTYQVYGADFVNTEEGTGIVHTAVMYGQDDFELGTKVGLPKVHLVSDEGHFMPGTDFLEGKFVKDEETAVEIIKDLAKRGRLFKKEKYTHSYPHCWRCNTPLIYYARDSWYIKMSSLREELVKENEKINWEPSYIKEGRFGEWLREVKDWAVSRERYWGTPLPVWQNAEGKFLVLGSLDELKKHTRKSGNKYFVMRHGEAENNVRRVADSGNGTEYSLTEAGIEQVKSSLKTLKNYKIDLIIHSPLQRTKETSSIIIEGLGNSIENLEDNRLRELGFGVYDKKPLDEYEENFPNTPELFIKGPEAGETLNDVRKRVGEFMYELESKYQNRNILIVSHGDPAWMMLAVASGAGTEECLNILKDRYLKTAEIRELDFAPLPHNENYELDLHRPYIDEVELTDENGEKLTRTKEVMDVWFDSGCMPFASGKNIPYPADFIAEAIDQTRGWFYTLHAVGVLMGKGHAYKNVICLGHILDKEGKKMSKSVGNVVEPWEQINKYGVDALRMWMYTVNGPGDSKNFDEKTVDEVVKKVFNPLDNILSFYKLYGNKDLTTDYKLPTTNVLDVWIVSKLNELVGEGTKNLDKFKIFEAARPIREFINDFSTWYIRRSRDRFKSENLDDKHSALQTTHYCLLTLAKYIAPFTPFFSEYLYRELKSDVDPESVHLCEFPVSGEVDKEVIKKMEEVRNTVSLALEKRNSAGIKVRQPLKQLTINNSQLTTEYLDLVRDEVNVKEIVLGDSFELDAEITPELAREGLVREFIRAVQELRKENNLMPDQKIILQVDTSPEGQTFITSSESEISRPTGISAFEFTPNSGTTLQIGEISLKIKVK